MFGPRHTTESVTKELIDGLEAGRIILRPEDSAQAFRELPFAEQAKSIAATIDRLQAAIEHHVEHSPSRLETIEKCLAQLDRLSRRLRDSFHRPGAQAGSGRGIPTAEEVPRSQVGSPRLARPEQADDFTMEVGEESRDAGLR